MTGDRVAEIRERVNDAANGDDAELKANAETDVAYLLAKVEQWKHIVVRVTSERNAAEAENARLRAQLDTVLELADNAPLVPVHAGGGKPIYGKPKRTSRSIKPQSAGSGSWQSRTSPVMPYLAIPT